MLSDDSSSDSETGRFKSTKKEDESKKNSNDSNKCPRRERGIVNDRYGRDSHKKRDDRDLTRLGNRNRSSRSRYSPPRRRYSRERSPYKRRSRERYQRSRDVREKSKTRDRRSSSKDKQKQSTNRSSNKFPDQKNEPEDSQPPEEKSIKYDRRIRDNSSSEVEPTKNKRSEVVKPVQTEPKKKSTSPIIIDEHITSDSTEAAPPSSYYNMVSAVLDKKSAEESSEIDSSDDERLRAKLLNLEKELRKTRKKKHRKKHKRKISKSKERDLTGTVEVTSTTDIQESKIKPEDEDGSKASESLLEATEISSTQKGASKESSEEGEISSDEDSQSDFKIDPSDLRHKLKKSTMSAETADDNNTVDICGPALPPHLQGRFNKGSTPDVEGPALPPHLKKNPNIGPNIPEDMRKVLANTKHRNISDSPDDDVGIGPLPAGDEGKWSDAHKRLEERALDMKIRKLEGRSSDSSDKKYREQWMLELPEGKAKILGLEARSFRAKKGPDMSDRSSWTDTPEEKARKASGAPKEEDAAIALQRDVRSRHIAARDEQQEREAKKHKKKHKRDESLLDLHQKKLKKKKKKEEKDTDKKERRPFSRDVDLQVNRFDEAQKKSIIKKAQNLDSRFSRGEAKYL